MLREDQATTANQAERIDDSRQVRALAIPVFHSPARANEAHRLNDELTGFGAAVHLYEYTAYASLNSSVKLTHTTAHAVGAERIVRLPGNQIEFDKVSTASSDQTDVFIHLYGE